jgi:hypothetical protein
MVCLEHKDGGIQVVFAWDGWAVYMVDPARVAPADLVDGLSTVALVDQVAWVTDHLARVNLAGQVVGAAGLAKAYPFVQADGVEYAKAILVLPVVLVGPRD